MNYRNIYFLYYYRFWAYLNQLIKNSFEFTRFVNQASHRSDDIMVSFDVVSLFTNVPIDVTTKFAEDLLKSDKCLNERTSLPVPDIIALL